MIPALKACLLTAAAALSFAVPAAAEARRDHEDDRGKPRDCRRCDDDRVDRSGGRDDDDRSDRQARHGRHGEEHEDRRAGRDDEGRGDRRGRGENRGPN